MFVAQLIIVTSALELVGLSMIISGQCLKVVAGGLRAVLSMINDHSGQCLRVVALSMIIVASSLKWLGALYCFYVQSSMFLL